jgi:uncharacterized protein
MQLSLDEGRRAVAIARETLEAHVKGGVAPKGSTEEGVFAENRGVFVTLNTCRGDSKALRGCIGYPEPIKPLGQAIRDVAVYASEDPRFPTPVGPEELRDISVEVSVLTLPIALAVKDRRELPSKIRLGTDGVIVSRGYASALFLPQVAPEQGWDGDTFLSEACAKAGLPMDAWLDPGTSVQVFQAEVFGERVPNGPVERVDSTER